MNKGLTIIELLVVIAITAILLAVIFVNVSQMGNISESNYRICDIDGNCEYVKDYQENDNCVKYEKGKICGEYTIKNLK